MPSLPDIDKPMRLINAIETSPELGHLPIYLANVFSRPAATRPKVPEGVLWRIIPHPDNPRFTPEDWTAEAILDRHLAAYQRMGTDPTDFTPQPSDPWSDDLAYAYTEKARKLAIALAQEGNNQAASQVAQALKTQTGQDLQ